MRFTWAIAMGMVVSLAPRAALGQSDRGGPCVAEIDADSAVEGPWDDAIRELRENLATRGECAPAKLLIVREGVGVRIEATTPAGLRAERFAITPAAFRAIAFGLIASIPRDVRRPKVAVASNAIDPPAAFEDGRAPLRPPRIESPRLVGAFTVGARLGMPTRVLAAEGNLRGDVFVDDWFLTAVLRYAPLGTSLRVPGIPGYAYDEVAIALGGGARFPAGSVLVDLAIAPAIVIMTEEADVPADGAGGTEVELRCDLLLRALFGRGRFKPLVAVDLELAPFALKTPVQAAASIPPFPSWTVGIGAGLAGDLL